MLDSNSLNKTRGGVFVYACKEYEIAARHDHLAREMEELNFFRFSIAKGSNKQHINELRRLLSANKGLLKEYYDKHGMSRYSRELKNVGILSRKKICHHLLNFGEIRARELEDELFRLRREVAIGLSAKISGLQ